MSLVLSLFASLNKESACDLYCAANASSSSGASPVGVASSTAGAVGAGADGVVSGTANSSIVSMWIDGNPIALKHHREGNRHKRNVQYAMDRQRRDRQSEQARARKMEGRGKDYDGDAIEDK